MVLQPDQARVRIRAADGERELSTRLLVLADGARSRGRELVGIDAQVSDYGQAAVIANLTPQRDHGGRAFERFGVDGPIALLPLTGGRSALIWTLPQERLDAVMAADDQQFLAQVQQRGWGGATPILWRGWRRGS